MINFIKKFLKKEEKKQKLTELDRLRLWSSLLCTIFQHTHIQKKPDWLITIEDDGYYAEAYLIGWENDNFSLEISIEENDNEEYVIISSLFDSKDFKYIFREEHKIESFLSINPISEELNKIVSTINEIF